jgi:CTP synthase
MTKYIFTIGGVLSGLGKGITTASVGMLLKQKGFKVTAVKIDPYINIDAGTMRPAEHGETFVTADGAEIDQDSGNYERFLNINMGKGSNITTGKIFESIIAKERSFFYKGRDVEYFPDVINEIKEKIKKQAKGFDFCMVEVGGTSGDLENMPFLHAAREIGREAKAVYLMVTYLPFLRNVGELKTKPTQHAIANLRSVGIFPDFVITRNEVPIDQPRVDSIANRCFINPENIIDNPDTDNIYKIPLIFDKANLAEKILKILKVKDRKTDLTYWKKFVKGLENPVRTLRIGMVGKYFRHGGGDHKDVYISVNEALKHASGNTKFKVKIVPINSEDILKNTENRLKKLNLQGLIAPQGWGTRGTEGIISAINYARKTKIPFLGLCFGMQLASVEYARNMAGIKKANSAEIDKKTKEQVIHIMPDQKEYLKKKQYGGTIRLGDWPCTIKKGTVLHKIYKQESVSERHRHRYEFNNKYKNLLEKAGFIFSGTSPDGKLIEAIELSTKDHPFFVATQFHPELKSRPQHPHPIFVSFLTACDKA